MLRLPRSTAPRQRGLSLVELMIGIAVALFIVATASVMMASQLSENRQLLLETKVDQELRAAAEVIVRDLRVAGFSHDAAKQVGYLGAGRSPYAARFSAGSASQPSTEVLFAAATGEGTAVGVNYSTINEISEASGYKLDDEMIRVKIGNTWQPLTDPRTVRITGFNLSSTDQTVLLSDACSPPCPVGADCPRQTIRTVRLLLTAQAAHDARVSRSFSTSVRVRNDAILGSCPA